jgi:tagatose-6-phosphate ketose/aldose isomerase
VLEHAFNSFPNVVHLVVSCNGRGRMLELAIGSAKAYAILLDAAVNDRSSAMTSSFTNMVIFGRALATLWNTDDFEIVLTSMTHNAEFLLEDDAYLPKNLLAVISDAHALWVATCL